jgi:hypothetical protein
MQVLIRIVEQRELSILVITCGGSGSQIANPTGSNMGNIRAIPIDSEFGNLPQW